MSKREMIMALAEGIKGELDGYTIYEEAAARSDGEVREFFLERAAEEKLHYNWLSEHYRRLTADEPMEDYELGKIPEETSPVISAEFLERIGKDRYLSAAIATSVLMEIGAIEHYRKSAENCSDPDLAELFLTLAKWETLHYEILLKIQEDSRELWFAAQGFEPF